MTSLLQQLENNEAVLLMYLADELPADDRAEVEAMLATDAALRAELDQLTRVQDLVMSGLAALDQTVPGVRSESAAVRQVSRAITRWHLERDATPRVAPVKQRGLRIIPWWAYPLTAAAAIIVAFVAWSENRPFILKRVSTLPPIARVTVDPDTQDQQLAHIIPEPDQMRSVAVSQQTRDTGDLFGNDW